jgi:putative endonuclease
MIGRFATRCIRAVRSWFAPLSLGQRGELAAERFLKRQGYKIVARRSRDRLGEIDLVAVDGRTVVFVEVKTRRTTYAGGPEEAVDSDKQRRLSRLALGWLKRHDLLECAARFDILAVLWPENARKPCIEHFKSAFEAAGIRGMFS